MKIPIVMATFGTTTRAAQTYDVIDKRIRSAFPGHPVSWSYTSKIIKHQVNRSGNEKILDPPETLQQLADQGYKSAVVQSLHMLAGYEFNRLKQILSQAEIETQLGLPLLSNPDDYRKISSGLIKLLDSRPDDEALVLVGHGTDHPSWSSFIALEHFLRNHFGRRVFLGCVEHYPSGEETVTRIAAHGFTSACLVPFMLVAGYHFQKELLGEEPQSWKSLFQHAAIDLDVIDRGIGMEPFISDILVSHIRQAIGNIRQ